MDAGLTWPINKRILLVATNLIIMVTVLACAILSLVELKLLPDDYHKVDFQTLPDYPECQLPVLADASAWPTPDGVGHVGANCTKVCTQRLQTADQNVTGTNQSDLTQPLALVTHQVRGYATLHYVISYFLFCFLPKQEEYDRDSPQSEKTQLPAYIEELFVLIKESLRFSIGTNSSGFFAAFLGLCAAILRSSSLLKISAALSFLDMVAEMGAAAFIFVGHDKTHNRNRYRNFDLLVTSMCHRSSVCIQPVALALIGCLICIAVVAQVSSIVIACKIVSYNAQWLDPYKRLRRLTKRGIVETNSVPPSHSFGLHPVVYPPYSVSYGPDDLRSMTMLPANFNNPYFNGFNQQYPPINFHPMNNGCHFPRSNGRDINIIA